MIDIDFKKYKRIFVFGCSFTSYIWPTWADVIHSEMPDSEYYNFGQAGGGNMFIASRVAEANAKFKFTDTDLVMIMWSTFCREDRWVKHSWLTLGNIYNQGLYDKEWVKKFADTRGYFIRDLSLIELTTNYLKSTHCGYLGLTSVPIEYDNESSPVLTQDVSDITETYKKLIATFHGSLLEVEFNSFWTTCHSYYPAGATEINRDSHPSPMRYYNYLKKIGLNLSEKSEKYATESEQKLKAAKHFAEIISAFIDLDVNRNNARRLMF